MQENHPHAAFLDRMGGPAEVTRIVFKRTGVKLSPQAVSNWRARGVPDKTSYRNALVLEAAELGVAPPRGFMGGEPPPAVEPPPAADVDSESESGVPFLH